MVGKNNTTPSPWLSKLTRYTAVLNAGDVLINPPWFWHGIDNLGDASKGDLVIGSPVRYGGKAKGVKAAFFNHPVYTLNSFVQLYRKYGLAALKPGFKINLQSDIANGRRTRGGTQEIQADVPEIPQEIKESHPFDESD